jgi:hypothetical protein
MISQIFIVILIVLIGLSSVSIIVAPLFFYKKLLDPVGKKKSLKFSYIISCFIGLFSSVLIYLEEPSRLSTALFILFILLIFFSLFYLLQYLQVKSFEKKMSTYDNFGFKKERKNREPKNPTNK